MGKNQWALLAFGCLLVAILYFGFSIRPPEAAKKDKERSLQAVQTSAAVLINDKMPSLKAEAKRDVQALNSELKSASKSADSLELLKELSGVWFSQNEAAVAGYYAKKVAEILNTAEAWSIAGTTFAYGLNKSSLPEKEKEYIISESRKAFENAISLAPDTIDHRVNLAVTFVKAPPEDNPMKGIQMLLRLNEEYPDHAAVLFQLGRFGIQTGQYEKAIARLEKAVSLEPKRTEAYCLLSKAYLELGQSEKARQAEEKCKKQD